MPLSPKTFSRLWFRQRIHLNVGILYFLAVSSLLIAILRVVSHFMLAGAYHSGLITPGFILSPVIFMFMVAFSFTLDHKFRTRKKDIKFHFLPIFAILLLLYFIFLFYIVHIAPIYPSQKFSLYNWLLNILYLFVFACCHLSITYILFSSVKMFLRFIVSFSFAIILSELINLMLQLF